MHQNRAVRALRRPANWVQLFKFGVVGASGYVINLVVYAALLGIGRTRRRLVSFVVSAANNYWWNRHWTFVGQKGHFALQGMRFFAVSFVALLVEPALALRLPRLVRAGEDRLAGARDRPRDAAELPG